MVEWLAQWRPIGTRVGSIRREFKPRPGSSSSFNILYFPVFYVYLYPSERYLSLLDREGGVKGIFSINFRNLNFQLLFWYIYRQCRTVKTTGKTYWSLSNNPNVFVNFLLIVIKSAKYVAANQSYDAYIKRFKTWCLQYDFQPVPASVATFSFFLTSLVQQRVSSSVLESFYYSIDWIHS